MNGGNCTAPGVCSCPPGFQGPYCEGGEYFRKIIYFFFNFFTGFVFYYKYFLLFLQLCTHRFCFVFFFCFILPLTLVAQVDNTDPIHTTFDIAMAVLHPAFMTFVKA